MRAPTHATGNVVHAPFEPWLTEEVQPPPSPATLGLYHKQKGSSAPPECLESLTNRQTAATHQEKKPMGFLNQGLRINHLTPHLHMLVINAH